MKKASLFAILTVLVVSASLQAQTQTYEPPSSWSIDVMGGITNGYFTFGSDFTPHGGVQVRYSVNPMVSLYGNAGGGIFKSREGIGTGASFENTYIDYGVGVRANLLRMMSGPVGASERFSVFTQAGLSAIRNDVTVSDVDLVTYPSQNFSGSALLYRLGLGASMQLSRSLDVFAMGQINWANSDLLDGYERATGAAVRGLHIAGDSYANLSVGITLKLGDSNTEHTDWYSRDHRLDPLTQSLNEAIARLEDEIDIASQTVKTTQERLQVLERSLGDLNHMVTGIHSDQFMEQYRQIESLQTRVQMMQSEFDEVATQFSDYVETREAEPEARYFVVAGVFRSMDNAEGLLREIQAQGFTEAEIIRDRSRNFYIVNYAGYATEQEAASVLDRIRTDRNPDSWIYVR